MPVRLVRSAFSAFLLAAVFCAPARAQYYLDIEGGRVEADHNTVKIPLDGGTRVSLTDELRSDPAAYGRVRFGKRYAKSDISFLAAPLTLRSSGVLRRNTNFAGTVLPGGSHAEAVYRFNSYRLRYLYEFYRKGGLVMRYGGTLKLRHAGITLTAGGTGAESKDTGFVPLGAFSLDYALKDGWTLLVDADALAAPQGRAEDVMLAVGVDLRPGLRARAGYRFLEGGSGAGEVYTFAWLNYFLAGLTWEF